VIAENIFLPKPHCVICHTRFSHTLIILCQTNRMLIYDTNCLTFKEAIVDTPKVKLILFTHETGILVLMASLKKQPAKVFFTTDEIYLQHFIAGKICLQLFFESIASNFVTVSEGDEFRVCMRSHADIQLCEGEKLFSEFKNRNTVYAFPMQRLIAR
jgi:hypothetical protein